MNENTKLILGPIAAVALTLATVLGLNQADVETPVSEQPHAETPVHASHPGCPADWTPATPDGENHVIVYKCLRDDWHVVVFDDGSFSHAWQENTPTVFIYEPREGWGWPVQ